MKLIPNVGYILKDNKGYVMAVDQSTSFKTIINFVGDYTLDVIDVGLMYMRLQDEQVAYIYLAKAIGRAVTLSNLESMKLEVA